MEIALSNRTVTVPEKSVMDPRAAAIKSLEERKMAKELADYTDDELYAELDRIDVKKARLPRRRDQYTDHTRRHWNDRRRQVVAELKRRGLPVKKRGSQKTLATAAHLAAQKRELGEVAA